MSYLSVEINKLFLNAFEGYQKQIPQFYIKLMNFILSVLLKIKRKNGRLVFRLQTVKNFKKLFYLIIKTLCLQFPLVMHIFSTKIKSQMETLTDIVMRRKNLCKERVAGQNTNYWKKTWLNETLLGLMRQFVKHKYLRVCICGTTNEILLKVFG